VILVNPYPSALSGFEARLEYTRQLSLHVLGLQKEWDVGRINAAYSRHAESQRLVSQKQAPNRKSRPFKLSPLPEVNAQTDPQWKEKFQQIFIAKETPVVVRGLQYVDTAMFPEARNWGINYLLEKVYKNTSVPVFTNTTNDKSVVMEPFADYVEGLKNKSKVRYARCLDDRNHTMMKGFSVDGVAELMGKGFEQKATVAMNGDHQHCLFVGSNHVNTRMHSDIGTSAFLMIQGRKRWTMFPPSQSMYFLPVGHLYNVAYNSLVDIFADNILEKYPFASLAEGWDVVIEPGDVLFFPAFTWHGVENLDEITVGLDLAIYDTAGSLRRNPILASGSIFNLNVWWKVLSGLVSGKAGSFKAVFFEGYFINPPKN